MLSISAPSLAQVISDFRTMPQAIQTAVLAALDRMGIGFIDYLRVNKLSGSPLNRITGALQASFKYDVSQTADSAALTISSDSPYAAYHEYGFHGTENVRAHSRLGHPVRAHARTVDYPGRPYLDPAMTEFEPTILAEVEAAINSAVQK